MARAHFEKDGMYESFTSRTIALPAPARRQSGRLVPLGEDAFRKAAAEDKPVFLSIGYSTCHWCHVMAHESLRMRKRRSCSTGNSFRSRWTGRNARISTPVYGGLPGAHRFGQGGPHHFHDAGAAAFFAGTYFPKHRRYGQPGLVDLLTRIGRSEKRPRAASAGRRTAHRRDPGGAASPPAGTGQGAAVPGIPALPRTVRPRVGRLWTGAEISHAAQSAFLMRYARLEQQPDALAMAETTLRARPEGLLKTSSAAVFRVTPPMKNGWSRTSKRCCMTTPCCSRPASMPIRPRRGRIRGYRPPHCRLYPRGIDGSGRGILLRTGCRQRRRRGKYYVFTPGEVHVSSAKPTAGDLPALWDHRGGNFEGKSIPNRIGREEPPLFSRRQPAAKALSIPPEPHPASQG